MQLHIQRDLAIAVGGNVGGKRSPGSAVGGKNSTGKTEYKDDSKDNGCSTPHMVSSFRLKIHIIHLILPYGLKKSKTMGGGYLTA
jgi:hypothetical protein